ncbi:TetR/AcrR family transcriptional regulator [Paenibacillus elgii]
MTAHKIKASALRLFSQNSYDAVPLSEIAKEVGIKTPSLYAHFKSKEELFLTVYDDCLAEHASRVRQMTDKLTGLGTEQKLQTILLDVCRTYLLSEEYATFLKRTMLFPPSALQEVLRERFAASEEQLTELLRMVFEEGMASGILRREHSEDLTASFYCLLDGSFLQQFYYRPDDWEHRLKAVWSIYWKGIAEDRTS